MQRSDIIGRLAFGSDGQRVGKIIDLLEDRFTVEKGLIFPRDTFVPFTEISRTEGDRVILREPAAYYRAGGDVDDGHWSAELARKSRLVQQGHSAAHEVGLTPAEEEDERAPGLSPAPGVHTPVASAGPRETEGYEGSDFDDVTEPH